MAAQVSTSRRYPASLSHNPSGPSRPQRPVSVPSSSIDDEVPPPPELPPLLPQPPAQRLPELSSLEYLLRQAGYKETRVFTPEAERVRPRLKQNFDDEGAGELASLYAAMGLDSNAPKHVGHMTQPAIPFRSSSSVLRNVALQDATAMLNALRQHRQQQSAELQQAPDAFWSPRVLDRAAAEVSKTVSAMSPPAKDNNSVDVGLRLARGGQGVRKAKSNFELVRPRSEALQQEDIPPQPEFYHEAPPAPRSQPTTIRPSYRSAFEREVPPSIASMFSPPQGGTPTEQMRFDDDAFGYNPLDYEAQDDDDIYAEAYEYGDDDSAASGSTPGTSPPVALNQRASPPLLDERNVYADLGFGDNDADSLAEDEEIAAAERQAQEIGQRILASTVEYDDDYSDDDSETDYVPVPTIAIKSPSPPPKKVQRVLSRADSLAQAMNDPLPIPMALPCTKPIVAAPVVTPAAPVTQLRPAKSAPALRSSKSRGGPLRISPALPAPPALQTVSPVICDSVGNDAEDLPPIPTPPPEAAPTSSFGYFAVRARKSLTALRASFWAAEAPPPLPQDSLTSGNPVLTPRVDWSEQGACFAGWNSDQDEKGQCEHQLSARKSMASIKSNSTVGDFDDPFCDPAGADTIDYTKSFFYKPTTPPRPDGTSFSPQRARKRSSVKSLKAALLLPVAPPPVPPIPAQYRRQSTPGDRTPQRSPSRAVPPQLCILSPGAWEEGRPARPLVLEGEEWEGHDVVASWGRGIRKGKGKKRASKRRSARESDSSSPEMPSSPLRHYGH